MRRAATAVLAGRLASALGASTSAGCQFTTSAAAAARLGAARTSGRASAGRAGDADRPAEWWEEPGWLDTAVRRGGGAAAANALTRRVHALGAQGERFF